MPYLEIFDGFEDAAVILQALKDDGLVGVFGGRLEVREKLRKVQSLIEREGLKGYWADSTINHSETELGYGYNEELFSIEKARRYVVKAYDEKVS